MAGETGGGGREGTFPSGPHKFHFLGGTRGTNVKQKRPFLLLLDFFLAIPIVVEVVLGPLRHMGTLFLGGPPKA